MNFFDIIFTIILLSFIFFGIKNGVISESLKLLGFFIGFVAAELYYIQLFNYLLPFISNVLYAKALTYGIIFFIGIAFSYILTFLAKILFVVHLFTVKNKLLGAVLGSFRGTVICMVLFFFVRTLIYSYVDDLESSKYYPFLDYLHDLVIGFNFA
ncbi:MAG: CvpA family protein [Deltaproteobacteria bacterium]|nr:CvpA family protein [Deltaproteobacteria bacterium]